MRFGVHPLESRSLSQLLLLWWKRIGGSLCVQENNTFLDNSVGLLDYMFFYHQSCSN